MAASAEEIRRLRRMVNEPTEETYDDDTLTEYIERYPLEDARGEGPLVESETTPGTLEANDDWTATYDLNAAAADLWSEKAGVVGVDFDFGADGGRYSRSQVFEQHMRMSRFYRSRRAITSVTMRPEPLSQGTEDVDD